MVLELVLRRLQRNSSDEELPLVRVHHSLSLSQSPSERSERVKVCGQDGDWGFVRSKERGRKIGQHTRALFGSQRQTFPLIFVLTSMFTKNRWNYLFIFNFSEFFKNISNVFFPSGRYQEKYYTLLNNFSLL